MVEYFINLKMTLTDSRSSINSEQKKYEEKHARHMVIKLLKTSNTEKKILKVDRMRAAFLSETRQARRHRNNNIKILKNKNCQPRF